MAAFASTSACALATLATIPRARGSISQHKSFTTIVSDYPAIDRCNVNIIKTRTEPNLYCREVLYLMG